MRMLGGAALLAAIMLSSTGCAPASPSAVPHPAELSDAAPESVVAEVLVQTGAGTATVQVHPLVRVGPRGVLTIDVDPNDDQPENRPLDDLQEPWRGPAALDDQAWFGVRLLDLEQDIVMMPAVDAAGETVAVRDDTQAPADAQRFQLAFDIGERTEDFTLLLPQAGAVPGIPVVDGDVPPVGERPGLDTASIDAADWVGLRSYAVDTGSGAWTGRTATQTLMVLSADELFAEGTIDPAPGAQQVIADIAAEMQRREPERVRVRVHSETDAETELSRRQAVAIAAQLRTTLDEASYPIDAEGVGAQEPAADGDGVGDRRVQIVIDSHRPVDTAPEFRTDLPAAEGTVATGAAGIDIDADRPWHVSIPRAIVIDGHVFVEVRTEARDEVMDAASGPDLFSNALPAPPELDATASMAGLVVMNGPVAMPPMLHAPAERMRDALVPLTDLATGSRLDGGQVRTSVLVYPEMTVGDTITVDLPSAGLRWTDIPVEVR